MNAFKRAWLQAGLPQNGVVHRMLYNPPASTIVIEVEIPSVTRNVHRIFVRTKEGEKYRPVGSGKNISCCSPVTCSGKALMFFNVFRLQQEAGSLSMNWMEIREFDLKHKKMRSVLARHNLLLPSHYDSGWVPQIIAASEDGETLFCAIGMRTREKKNLEYFLSEITLGSRECRTLARLRAVTA